MGVYDLELANREQKGPRMRPSQRSNHRRATAPDLLEYVGRRFGDQQLHCVLTFDSALDVERLARATRLALDAEPVLGSRFVERAWHSYWARRDDLDSQELCSLEYGTPVEGRLQRFMVTPGDPRVDPLLRILVLRSDVDTICIKLDHVAADASGLRDCVALLASIYARLAYNPHYRPEPNRDGDRGFRQVLTQFSLADKVAALRAGRRKVEPWGFPAASETCANRVILMRRIGPARLAALRACRLAHHATTNDVLLTAFFRALFEVIDPPAAGPLKVQFSVDLRQYLPQRRAGSICNLAGAVFPAIARRSDESFDATLVRVRDAMRAIEAARPGLAGTVVVETLAKLGLPLARKMAALVTGWSRGMMAPIFSNLGGLSSRADFGGPKITDGYLVGPVMFPGAFMLALSSSGKAVTMSAGFCEPGTSRADVRRLLDVIDRELPGS